MCKITTKQWKKLLVWVSAYVNVLAFVLVGGYFILKDNDEDVKREVKDAFWVTLAFVALSAVVSLYGYLGNALEWWSVDWVYKIYAAIVLLNNVGRIVAFAVFTCISFFKKEDCCCAKAVTEETLEEKKEESQE